MTSYFPDVNVWVALSLAVHPHSSAAWRWLEELPRGSAVIFSRYTQIGLLRLLTTQAAMGVYTHTLGAAWELYDRWTDDPRVISYPEPARVEETFRAATQPFANQTAAKAVGDCYLLACAAEWGATLVTFDRALAASAKQAGRRVVVP